MPQVAFNTHPKINVAIWNIQEDETFFVDNLPPHILQHYTPTAQTIKSDKRRIQWWASRKLVYDHLQTYCTPDPFGKPILPQLPQQHLSLSHSDHLVALAYGNQPMGIDIQTIQQNIHRLAPKFASPLELATVLPQQPTAAHHLHAYWGAKEALYKAYGRRQLDFKAHIHIQPFNYQLLGDVITGYIQKNEFKSDYTIHYQLFNDCSLVFAYPSTL